MNIENYIDRKTFLKLAALLAFSPSSAAWSKSHGVLVNDIHSQLNPIKVNEIVYANSLNALSDVIKQSAESNRNISFCGGRHAGGGQQFGTDAILLDTTKLKRVLNFDNQNGCLEVEAGIHCPNCLNI